MLKPAANEAKFAERLYLLPHDYLGHAYRAEAMRDPEPENRRGRPTRPVYGCKAGAREVI